MDVATTEPTLLRAAERWLSRERDSGRFYRWATIGLVLLLAIILAFSVNILVNSGKPGTFLSPPLIALLLVANLIPAIALMVLLSRKFAMTRAEKGGLGGGQLHTRLVALFSVVAAVPTVMVAIFASLLFQSGLEFWFSDRARGMIENAVELGRTTYQTEVERSTSV